MLQVWTVGLGVTPLQIPHLLIRLSFRVWCALNGCQHWHLSGGALAVAYLSDRLGLIPERHRISRHFGQMATCCGGQTGRR